MEFKKGRSCFKYCKKTKDKNNLFHYYAAKENTVSLDKISSRDIDSGIKPVDMFTYYCKTRGTVINYAIDSLKILGIENIYLLKRKDLKENEELQLICKYALKDRPQLLEKPGIKVLSPAYKKKSKAKSEEETEETEEPVS